MLRGLLQSEFHRLRSFERVLANDFDSFYVAKFNALVYYILLGVSVVVVNFHIALLSRYYLPLISIIPHCP